MSYDTEKLKVGREPVVLLELDLDECQETFDSAPCTASGAAGSECYNAFKHCQDQPNYNKGTKTYRFAQPRSGCNHGIAHYPCMVGEPKFTPTKITPDKGLGWRGTISVKLQDFPHHDRGVDPYVSTRTYDPSLQGTFFGKLKARNPYYKGRIMRVKVGYITTPFTWDNFETRAFVIESIDGPDSRGMVTVKGTDILSLTDNSKAQAPDPSDGTLSAGITDSDTSLALQTGEGVDYNTDPYTGNAVSATYPGYVRIGDEVIKYTGISTDTLTGLVRGQFGTPAESQDEDDLVQQCLFYNGVNVVDILDHLLKVYCDIPEEYIPYDAGLTVPTGTDDEWDFEKADWLSSNTLTRCISGPEGVNDLIVEMMEQNLMYIWWDEIDQEIKLRAIAPTLKNEIPRTINDVEHMLADTLKVKDLPKRRISQLWVYYEKINLTDDDKPTNYKSLHVHVDTDSEGENAFDEKSIKIIYANWLTSGALVVTLAGRLLNRFNETPREIKFSIDARDTDIWTGSSLLIDSHVFQDSSGANELRKAQILQITEKKAGHEYEIIAESTVYQIIRYGFIMVNTAPDYSAASDEEKQTGGYISDGSDFADGGTQYNIA